MKFASLVPTGRKCVSGGSAQKSNDPSRSFSQGVAGFIGAEFSISQQLYVLSILSAAFSRSSFARIRGREDGHSFSMDPLRRIGEMPRRKKEKRKKKYRWNSFDAIPASADLWEVIKILRRYHAVGTHRYAEERVENRFLKLTGWLDGMKMKGTIEVGDAWGEGGGENRDGSPYMIVWASRSFVEFVGFFFYDFW